MRTETALTICSASWLSLQASLLVAPAPAAVRQRRASWLVGTTAGIRSAASHAGHSGSLPGVRVVRGDRATLRRLRSRPDVRWVEPNRHFSAELRWPRPRIRFFRQQWALRAARVPRAWRTSVGGERHRGGPRHWDRRRPSGPRTKPLDEPGRDPGERRGRRQQRLRGRRARRRHGERRRRSGRRPGARHRRGRGDRWPRQQRHRHQRSCLARPADAGQGPSGPGLRHDRSRSWPDSTTRSRTEPAW